MKKNMGTFDRILRTLVAIIFIALYFTHVITGWAGITLIVLALVFLLTSLVSFCPLYLPFGIKTNKE